MSAPNEVDPYGKAIGCKSFLALNLAFRADLEALVELLIVTRRHEAPLRVKSPSHCFVRLGIFYAERFYQGKMPRRIDFIWPYLKHEAVENKAVLQELALGQRVSALMPPGVLDGKTIEQIKGILHEGRIPVQVYEKNNSARMALQNAIPEPVSFLEDTYNDILRKNRKRPLGAHQNKTQSPVRHTDAEEHGASGVVDNDAVMDENPPQPDAQETTVPDNMDVTVNTGLRTNAAGEIVVSRESVPSQIWEALETVRGRGAMFLTSFVRDVIDWVETDSIDDSVTLDEFRDLLISEHEHIPEIKAACKAVNWNW